MTTKINPSAFFYTGHRINPSHKKNGETNALYSKGRYRTKISPKDLPEWYIYGSMYGGYGFISAQGVKHLLYIPEYTRSSGAYCNDILLISYDQPIVPLIKENGSKWYSGYDCRLSGQEIVVFIDAVERHTGLSTESIRKELRKKVIWYVETDLKLEKAL